MAKQARQDKAAAAQAVAAVQAAAAQLRVDAADEARLEVAASNVQDVAVPVCATWTEIFHSFICLGKT